MIDQYSSGTNDPIAASRSQIKPHGDGLHAPGGQSVVNRLPDEGGDLVAHQPVHHAPRLLGVDQVLVDVRGRYIACSTPRWVIS